jgi:RNA polymerase sigma-70 factor (ECF subfamily)
VDDSEARIAVDAVLRGDRDAFRVLVERESTSVIRVCHRVLGDVRDAEDAAQEAFVTAYRSLDTWRGEGSFGAWIARIAVRVALRQASRRRPVTWIDPLAVEAPESGADARNPAERASRAALTAGAIAATPGHDPASIAVRGEREVAVRAAVAGLEEPYREVVALRFFGDLSLAEIAQVSERPLGTVKTHLRRGLGRLRDSLAIAAVR